MFSENEIATLIAYPEIDSEVQKEKETFIKAEASMLQISDHDFLSLIMMTPAVGVALANGSVSLFEELALNKMARKMSKGGYFMKVDPVAHAMKYLINNFQDWEDRFCAVIRLCMTTTMDMESLKNISPSNTSDPIQDFARDLMKVPYFFVRFLSIVVLNDESDIVEYRSISKVEFEKIQDIGKRLDIAEHPVFGSFCNTFDIK